MTEEKKQTTQAVEVITEPNKNDSEKKEVAIIDETKDLSQADIFIRQAIEKNVPVETLERLMKMRKELKAEAAREVFDKAMAGFQADCPEIKKTKVVKTKTGQVAYKYAPIDVIVSQVKSILKKHGFSYSVQTKTEPGKVKSICIVKHSGGHREDYEMEVPLGNKTQVMSDSQVVAAASTFSKRYAFCNAFGILTGDEDDDARSINTQNNQSAPTQSQKNTSQRPVQANNKHYCQRCEQNGKNILISKLVADYSIKNYGLKLCQPCQKLARKYKEQSEISNYGKKAVINNNKIIEIEKEAKENLNFEDQDMIIAWLQTVGIASASLKELTYEQADIALKLIKSKGQK